MHPNRSALATLVFMRQKRVDDETFATALHLASSRIRKPVFLRVGYTMSSATDIIEHMHSTASQYHLHFSTVRTTSTSLVLPIGLLASVTMIAYPSFGCVFPIFFVAFIVVTSLYLNIVFSGWSRACRRIERYYESLLHTATAYDPQLHAFRHVFAVISPMALSCKAKREANSRYMECKNKDATFPTRIKWLSRDWINDPFVTSILLFGPIYLIIYALEVNHVFWD